MHLIDTNIFLEILLGRRRKEECKNAESIISFDKHFDGLKIPRKEPVELID